MAKVENILRIEINPQQPVEEVLTIIGVLFNANKDLQMLEKIQDGISMIILQAESGVKAND